MKKLLFLLLLTGCSTEVAVYDPVPTSIYIGPPLIIYPYSYPYGYRGYYPPYYHRYYNLYKKDHSPRK